MPRHPACITTAAATFVFLVDATDASESPPQLVTLDDRTVRERGGGTPSPMLGLRCCCEHVPIDRELWLDLDPGDRA